MASTAQGRDQRSDDIELPALVEMFRRATRRGPCPDERMLDRFPLLHSVTWVRRWDSLGTKPKPAWQPAEQDVRKALKSLGVTLPALIDTYCKLAGLPPFGERVVPLIILQRLIPAVLAALGPDSPRTQSLAWHAAASLIAEEAMGAWRLAGRRQFGANPASPLVRFTQEFLARADIEKELGTIAAAFQGGLIDRQGEPPTTENLLT